MKNRRTTIWMAVLGLIVLQGSAFGAGEGYFKFDTFANNIQFTDDSGMGMKGLLGKPFSTPTSSTGVSGGASDKAVTFDGRGALVVDDSAAKALNVLQPPITVECWVRSSVEQLAGHFGFVSYGIPGGQPGGGGYKLGIRDGNLLFTLFAVVDVGTDVPFPFDGAWHHIAAVYSVDGGGVTFYMDGVEVAYVAETRNMNAPGANELDIGSQYTALGRFQGDIDRVRISNAALALDQLDSVAATPKPVAASTLAYFSFDEGAIPYVCQGAASSLSAISVVDWVKTNPPKRSDGVPTIATDTPSGAAGDTSLQFTGTQIAFVEDSNGVLNATGDWTVEAWVKTDFNTDVERMMIFYYGNPGHGYSMSINITDGNVLQVTTLGIADLPSTLGVVEPDVWTHLAVVHRAGTSLSYYANGVEKETNAYTSGTNAAEIQTLYIGAEHNGGLPFTGFIDRIRISTSALEPSQFDSNPAPTALGAWDLF
ncbi:MAG: LamG domain-containing protein [bacterium]